MKRLEWLARRASDALVVLGGICLIFMMLHIALDVALKYVFNSPIEGTLEIVSYYYMVGVVFLPLAMTELRHEHINVDLFVQMLPHRISSFFYAFGCLVSLVFFSVLAYQTYQDAWHAYSVTEVMMGSIYVTIWPARWILPISFTVIVLAIVVHAIKALRDPDRFKPLPSTADLPLTDRS